MLTSAFFLAAGDVAIKLIGPELTVWQIGVGRFLFGAATIPLLAWGAWAGLRGQRRGLLLLRGVTGTGAFLCLIMAIKTLPLSLALVLFCLRPAFGALLSPLICRERTSGAEWLAVTLSFGGAVLILWPAGLGPGLTLNHLFPLAAAFLSGVVICLIRRLSEDDKPTTIYFYYCLVGMACCLAPLFLQPQPVVPSRIGLIGLALIGGFTLAGQLAMNYGFALLGAARGGVLLMAELVGGATFGIIFLGEPLSWRLLIGAGLILGCGAGLSLRGRKEERQDLK